MAIKVNLVPAELLLKAQQKQQILQASIAGALLAILIVIASAAHYYGLVRLENTLKYDQAELKKLEVIVAKVEELERTAAAVRARLGVITDLLKGRPMYPYFMSDFARSVPLGIRVVGLTTAGGGSSATPLKLTMTAEARSNDDIALWVRRMEDSGRFSGIELGAVTSTSGGEKVYSFSLKTTYTPQL